MKRKGEGTNTSRQLNAAEKAKLTIWIYNNKGLCASKTAPDLAGAATQALGFVTSESSILTIKNSVHPDLRRIRQPKQDTYYSNRKKMDARISDLEDKIERLFKELGIKNNS